MTSGAGIRKRQRARKFKAQQGRCWLCAGIMLLFSDQEPDWTHPAAATREHVIPRAHGGSDRMDNIRLTHRICNQTRGDILDEHDARRHVLEQIGGEALMYMRTEQARAPVLLHMVKEHRRRLRKALHLAALMARTGATPQKSNTGGRALPGNSTTNLPSSS